VGVEGYLNIRERNFWVGACEAEEKVITKLCASGVVQGRKGTSAAKLSFLGMSSFQTVPN